MRTLKKLKMMVGSQQRSDVIGNERDVIDRLASAR